MARRLGVGADEWRDQLGMASTIWCTCDDKTMRIKDATLGHLVMFTGDGGNGKKSGLYFIFEKYAPHEERWARKDFVDRTGARNVCLTYFQDTEAFAGGIRLEQLTADCWGMLPYSVNQHWWVYSLNSVTSEPAPLGKFMESVLAKVKMDYICVMNAAPSWMLAKEFSDRVHNYLAAVAEMHIS